MCEASSRLQAMPGRVLLLRRRRLVKRPKMLERAAAREMRRHLTHFLAQVDNCVPGESRRQGWHCSDLAFACPCAQPIFAGYWVGQVWAQFS
jgi:hypothetical protein